MAKKLIYGLMCNKSNIKLINCTSKMIKQYQFTLNTPNFNLTTSNKTNSVTNIYTHFFIRPDYIIFRLYRQYLPFYDLYRLFFRIN